MTFGSPGSRLEKDQVIVSGVDPGGIARAAADFQPVNTTGGQVPEVEGEAMCCRVPAPGAEGGAAAGAAADDDKVEVIFRFCHGFS